MLRYGIFRAARRAVSLASILQDDVDFRHLEPGQFDFDIEIDQTLQLDRQNLLVPPGLLGELVVGQDVGALMISLSSSIRTGLQKPNFALLAIWRTCFFECVRSAPISLRGSGLCGALAC